MFWFTLRIALSAYLLTRRRAGGARQLAAALLLPRSLRFLATPLIVGKVALDEMQARQGGGPTRLFRRR